MQLIPIILIGIVGAFLVINLFVGLFGVLWYNINLRKHEIGVRVSMGAYPAKIHQQFIGEMLVLATLGLLPGLVLAAQFPILNLFGMKTMVYVLAMLGSVLLIYILVVLCAFLPSASAAKTKPATALRDE